MLNSPQLQSRRENEIAQLQREHAIRMAKLKRIYGNQSPTPVGGALGRAMQQAGYSAEGVAFELFFTMLFNLLEYFANVQYRIQESEYLQAQDSEFDIAYEPGNGQLIYPLDEQGNVDFTQKPYPDDGFAPRTDIRANGYVPPPSQEEAYQMQWDSYTADMMGPEYLSSEAKERLYKTFGENIALKRNHDQNADIAYRQQIQRQANRQNRKT